MIRIHRFYIIDSAQINIGRTNSTCGILSKANDNPIRPHNDTILQTSRAIPHKERLATLHAICLQISLQSLFRIFPHASCVHIFRDISGKYSKIHKGFSPFFPSSLKKSDNAICIRQIRNRLSYFTKMLVNTSSIHSAFCFI